jgi:hypothetical protein
LYRRQQQQQRRLVKFKDVEFYSISFDLNLKLIDNASILNSNKEKKRKVNLLTLNSFNGLEDAFNTQMISLFGLNFYAKPLGTIEFELFTSQHTVRSEELKQLNKDEISLKINVTFTFKSIELWLTIKGDEKSQQLTKPFLILTDPHFRLFFPSKLKAYSSFKLDFISSSTNLNSSPSDTFNYMSCLTNFKLLTRKTLNLVNMREATEATFDYNFYDLASQTRLISLINTKPLVNNNFQCHKSNDYKKIDKNCFKLKKINKNNGQQLSEHIECDCFNQSFSLSSHLYTLCSFFQESQLNASKNFNFNNKISSGASSIYTDVCHEAKDYACFNNGTCAATNNDLLRNELPINDNDNDRNRFFKSRKISNKEYSCLCPLFFSGERCEQFDACLNAPCARASSTCISLFETYDDYMTAASFRNNKSIVLPFKCECDDGYLGPNCTIQFNETCLGHPCQNGGICNNKTIENDFSYTCDCAQGFEGKNCEKQINYCDVYSPCKNGAECRLINVQKDSISDEFYKCKCEKGWRGVNCTEDIDECADMNSRFIIPCSSKGRCVNSEGSYSCMCDDYYFGNNCENLHVCRHKKEDNLCKNDGICLVIGDLADNSYECNCPVGFSGRNCQFTTCDARPCNHATPLAQCLMINETNYYCNCTGTGYASTNCQNQINIEECYSRACGSNGTCDMNQCDCVSINCKSLKSSFRTNEFIYHFLLWPLLAIMLGLLIVLFSIFTMRMKKSRATRGAYSPSRHEHQASRIEFNMDLKRPPEHRLICVDK